MNKPRILSLVLASVCCGIGSFAVIQAQASAPAAIHPINKTANAKLPSVSMAHTVVQQMMKELGLTHEQELNVERIVERFQPQLTAMHSNTSLTSEKKTQQMSRILKDLMAKVSKVLTPQQNALFKQMVASIHGGHAHQ